MRSNPNTVEQLSVNPTNDIMASLDINKKRNQINMMFVGQNGCGNNVLAQHFESVIQNQNEYVHKYNKKVIDGRAAEINVYGTANGAIESVDAFGAQLANIDTFVIFVNAHSALEEVQYVE